MSANNQRKRACARRAGLTLQTEFSLGLGRVESPDAAGADHGLLTLLGAGDARGDLRELAGTSRKTVISAGQRVQMERTRTHLLLSKLSDPDRVKRS